MRPPRRAGKGGGYRQPFRPRPAQERDKDAETAGRSKWKAPRFCPRGFGKLGGCAAAHPIGLAIGAVFCQVGFKQVNLVVAGNNRARIV